MNVNKHISEYIKNNYLNSAIPPQFAVLVKGDWGCGKTFLVKKILEEKYGKEDWKKNAIWISVYGLSTIQQLKQKLFEKLHPFLTNKYVKTVFDIAKSAIKMTTTFDLNGDNKEDISCNFEIPDFSIDENGEKTNIKKILIIDDIERSSIPISELFGFVSEEIIEKNLKVIFISNDEEIRKLKNDSLNDYKSIKEKIIGMEFEVQPDIHEAVKFFVKEIGLAGYEKILLKKALSVLNNLKYSNLRSIRQSFVHIRYIFDILKDSLKKDSITENYISQLVEYFLVLFIQKANGKINTENEFIKAITVYKNYKQSLEVYNEEHKENDTNLVLFYGIDIVSLKDLYFNIIQQGDFSTESILADYKRFTEPDKKLTPLQKLTDWTNLSDKDFEKCYKSVEDDFDNNKILNQIEIVTWAQMKFCFSHFGIIDESFENIKNNVINYITRNKNQPRSIRSIDPNLSLINKGLYIEETKTFLDKIVAQLKQINHDLRKDEIKKQFEQLYSNLPEKMSELDYFICGYDGKSLDVPILSLLDNIKNFYQKIQKLDYSSQCSIFRSFEVRYERDRGKTECFQDIDKIKEISELYGKDVGDLKMSPKNVGNKWLSTFYEKLYCRMKEIKANTDKNNAN